MVAQETNTSSTTVGNASKSRRTKNITKKEMASELVNAINELYRATQMLSMRQGATDMVVMALLRKKFGMTDDDIKAFITEYTNETNKTTSADPTTTTNVENSDANTESSGTFSSSETGN